MRITLAIDDDVLSALKEMAAIEKKSVRRSHVILGPKGDFSQEIQKQDSKWRAAAQSAKRSASGNLGTGASSPGS